MTECLTCGGPTIRTQDKEQYFRICLLCNPSEDIDVDIFGCEIVCSICDSSNLYNEDVGSYCLTCDNFVCGNCNGGEEGTYIDMCTACEKEEAEEKEEEKAITQ